MEKKDFKIVFMGTPLIGKAVLEGLIANNYNVVLVVTNQDKVTGRKKELLPSEVKKVAVEHNIEVFQPRLIKEDYARILEVEPDVIITCAYGQIIPLGLLKAPKKGCINVHGSLLPHLRGASPIQSALFEGLKETGVTIMEMVEKMDAGKIYYQEKVAISDDENYTSLYDKMCIASKNALLKVLDSYLLGELKGKEQDETQVTFCKKIKPEDEYLSLDLPLEEFINKVKGLSYNPGGYVFYDNKKLKILRCKFYSHEIIKEKGYFIKKSKSELLLQLNNGLVQILEVQKENKNKMDSKSFMNGERNLEILKVS